MARLARGELSRLLFGSKLGGRQLCLQRFDVGFEHSNDLARQRSFIRTARPLDVAVNPSRIVPTIRRSNPGSLVVA